MQGLVLPHVNKMNQPALNVLGNLKPAEEITWYESESDERPIQSPPLLPETSVWESGLKTAKRLQPDRTKTGKDRTSSPVF
jgi:hypothetical protein